MSASKRRNDRAQQRKEEYALEEENGEEAGAFTRASADVMKKRRIVSASSRYKALSPKESNPFASIALAAPEKEDTSKLDRCNRAFLAWLRRQQDRAPSSSWADGVSDYLKLVAPLAKKPFAPAPGSIFAAPAKPLVFGNSSVPAPQKKKEPPPQKKEVAPPPKKDNMFTFGKPPSATETTKTSPFAFFGGAPPPPASESKSPFSFNPPPTTTSSSGPPPIATTDDDAMPLEAPAEVLKADDDDEVSLFEARAAIKRLDDKTWRDLGKGTARLSEHKTTKDKRVVVRNDVGKVLMNFKLDPKMTFMQQSKSSALTFQAICDADLGLQTYMLRTKVPLTPDLLQPAKFSAST